MLESFYSDRHFVALPAEAQNDLGGKRKSYPCERIITTRDFREDCRTDMFVIARYDKDGGIATAKFMPIDLR